MIPTSFEDHFQRASIKTRWWPVECDYIAVQQLLSSVTLNSITSTLFADISTGKCRQHVTTRLNRGISGPRAANSQFKILSSIPIKTSHQSISTFKEAIWFLSQDGHWCSRPFKHKKNNKKKTEKNNPLLRTGPLSIQQMLTSWLGR